VSRLSDVPIHTRLKLSLLWVSTVFCYIYCDYFELYIPGKLQGMLQGRMVPLGTVTQGTLVGTSLLLAIPSLMIFLSVVLRPAISRSCKPISADARCATKARSSRISPSRS